MKKLIALIIAIITLIAMNTTLPTPQNPLKRPLLSRQAPLWKRSRMSPKRKKRKQNRLW